MLHTLTTSYSSTAPASCSLRAAFCVTKPSGLLPFRAIGNRLLLFIMTSPCYVPTSQNLYTLWNIRPSPGHVNSHVDGCLLLLTALSAAPARSQRNPFSAESQTLSLNRSCLCIGFSAHLGSVRPPVTLPLITLHRAKLTSLLFPAHAGMFPLFGLCTCCSLKYCQVIPSLKL